MNFGPETPEFKKGKDVHPLVDQQFGYAAPLLDFAGISTEFSGEITAQFAFTCHCLISHVYFVGTQCRPRLFSERELAFTIAICYRPSVCCLSVCLLSVTLVHPTQAVKLFGNFFSPYDSPETLLF